MHTVNLAARLPSSDRRASNGGNSGGRNIASPQELLIEKKKIQAVNERLDIIRKALSILPEAEADQIYQDILSKKPAEIIKASQPYISKSYSLKLIDSRMITDPQKIPSLRVPLPIRKENEAPGEVFNSESQARPPAVKLRNRKLTSREATKLSRSVNEGLVSQEEMRLKHYVDNFYSLNEKLYQLHRVDQLKPQKLKERLPVRISAKTQQRFKELERRLQLQQFRNSASKVNLGFHRLYDADLYEDQKLSTSGVSTFNQLGSSKGFSEKSNFRSSHYKTQPPGQQHHEDDYNYDKNYNFYVQLNTGISRHFKIDKDKYKTGVYLGRSKQAGEELASIKNALKPFYPALPMSNLSIVREFYQVFKEKGSLASHKLGALKEDKSHAPDSPANTLQIGIPN
jgi:hypothetical protein